MTHNIRYQSLPFSNMFKPYYLARALLSSFCPACNLLNGTYNISQMSEKISLPSYIENRYNCPRMLFCGTSQRITVDASSHFCYLRFFFFLSSSYHINQLLFKLYSSEGKNKNLQNNLPSVRR